MKIAIFGGSFDPVHAEHVSIARAAREKLGADRVVVVPAFLPPHKAERHLAPAAARLEMARLALAGIPGCEVSPYEINAGGTSYTVRTLRRFRELYPQDELFLLVGADMLRDFYTWKQPEDILSMATLVACGREGDPADFKKEQKRFTARFGVPFVSLGYTGAAVSSTEVRVLCAFGEDARGLLPAEVADYIDANELYRVSPVRAALGYLTPARHKHSLRVALTAAGRAAQVGVSEYDAVLAAGLHDCAKNLPPDAPARAAPIRGGVRRRAHPRRHRPNRARRHPLPHLRPPRDERARKAHLSCGHARAGARLPRHPQAAQAVCRKPRRLHVPQPERRDQTLKKREGEHLSAHLPRLRIL